MTMLMHHMLRAAAGAGAAPPVATDPQFNYVSLLLNDTGTNGQQNNTFLDSSSNNFTITRNGTPTQGSVTPYWPDGQWSNQFSGSGQNLSVANNAALSLDTGDFTIEAWVYLNATTDQTVVASLTNSSRGYGLQLNSTSMTFLIFNGSSISGRIDYSGSIARGTWHHLAVSRSGTTTRLFLNGALVQTATLADQNAATTNPVFIAGQNFSGFPNYLNGYVSNLRIVKGTALYTSNFTPSTTPLTAVSGTSLLTCQSNRFKDNSSNNFAITVTGTPTVQAFEPFEPASSYATSVGGSGYFGGAASIYTPTSAAVLGTNDWTFEGWVYLNAKPAFGQVFGMRRGTASSADQYCPVLIAVNTTGFLFYSSGNSTSWNIVNGVAFGGTAAVNQWYHIAVVRNGTTITGYVNGVATTLATGVSPNYTSTNNVFVAGGLTSDYTNCYVSNARVVNGTAVYTAAFTPPTSPVTAITGTSLLLNCTSAGIYDAATLNDLVTVGNAQVSTAVAKFGSSSMAFDGTGDYLTAPDNPIFTLGAGNWTIESWIYTGVSSGNQAIIGQCSSSGGANTGSFVLYASVGGYPRIMIGVGSNWQWAQSSTLLPLNQWVHLASVRNGATITIYVNGVSSGTYAISTNSINDSTYSVAVGRTGEYAGEYLNGYIEDLRITKGYARYTANFSVPTAPFPTR